MTSPTAIGACVWGAGQYEKAMEAGREFLRLAPDDVSTYENLASSP